VSIDAASFGSRSLKGQTMSEQAAAKPEEPRFDSFADFWPHYVREHSKKTTRRLHFAGTTAAMACVAAALLGKRRFLLLAPIVGYGPSWIGHFFIEHNRPATFKHPIWSLKADMIMWSKMIAGTMDAEVDKAMADAPEKAPADTDAPAPKPASSARDQTLN
jgi:hypothetical protein